MCRMSSRSACNSFPSDPHYAPEHSLLQLELVLLQLVLLRLVVCVALLLCTCWEHEYVRLCLDQGRGGSRLFAISQLPATQSF